MGIDVGLRNVAEVRIQGVTLRSTVGGYEIVFGLMVNILADEISSQASQASIIGAQVSVAGREGVPETKLGFARPEGPFDIVTRSHRAKSTPSLHLYLQPAQIAALEALRDRGDLTFRLLLTGTGWEKKQTHRVDDEISHPVSQSDWIKKLREAGARDVMLLEVPLTLRNVSEEWESVAAGLRLAEEQFLNGNYLGCVDTCRTAMQELGSVFFQDKDWADKALAPLASHSDRAKMLKLEREKALFANVRHYTSLAHHGPSEGGELSYARTEAQFLLTLTAAAVARARAV
ncbi:MAG: hypothetical protein F4169_13705 [Gammaproteobacteria bacterium]|nr:hypothetical protein [Gammaproteobacteria bacterium]